MSATHRSLVVAACMCGLALAFLAGCPETTHVSSAPCQRTGDACQLANGTLGLCSESLAVACPSPPCLACTPQH